MPSPLFQINCRYSLPGLLVSLTLLAGCSGSKCEELRKVIGADPAIAGMTRDEECERALEQYKQLQNSLNSLSH